LVLHLTTVEILDGSRILGAYNEVETMIISSSEFILRVEKYCSIFFPVLLSMKYARSGTQQQRSQLYLRETGVSRQHGEPIEGHPEIL